MEEIEVEKKPLDFYNDLFLHDGYRFAPLFTPNGDVMQHLKNLNSLIFSEDEVVVASYPKSGSHWVYEIVNMLTTGKPDYTSRAITTYAFDFQTLEALQNRDYKVFGTHYYPRFLPQDFMKKQNKIICVYRNPKDVVVSFVEQIGKIDAFKDCNVEIEGFIEHFLEGKLFVGKWLDHIHEWEKYKREHPDHPVLIISYEDLKENLLQGVQKISNFLELNHSNSFIEGVAEKCKFSNMSKHKHANIPECVKSLSRDSYKESNIFFHKGMVGYWKNVLTVHQNDIIDNELANAIKGLDSKIRFTI